MSTLAKVMKKHLAVRVKNSLLIALNPSTTPVRIILVPTDECHIMSKRLKFIASKGYCSVSKIRSVLFNIWCFLINISILKKGLGCYNEYSERCWNSSVYKKSIEGEVVPAKDYVKLLCNDGQFQKEYLSHVGCFKIIKNVSKHFWQTVKALDSSFFSYEGSHSMWQILPWNCESWIQRSRPSSQNKYWHAKNTPLLVCLLKFWKFSSFSWLNFTFTALDMVWKCATSTQQGVNVVPTLPSSSKISFNSYQWKNTWQTARKLRKSYVRIHQF